MKATKKQKVKHSLFVTAAALGILILAFILGDVAHHIGYRLGAS